MAEHEVTEAMVEAVQLNLRDVFEKSGIDPDTTLDRSRAKRRAERVMLSTEHGAIKLSCPNCGAIDLIHGTVKGRYFLTRFNRFRRAHDWHCAVKADVALAREELDRCVLDQIKKAAPK